MITPVTVQASLEECRCGPVAQAVEHSALYGGDGASRTPRPMQIRRPRGRTSGALGDPASRAHAAATKRLCGCQLRHRDDAAADEERKRVLRREDRWVRWSHHATAATANTPAQTVARSRPSLPAQSHAVIAMAPTHAPCIA